VCMQAGVMVCTVYCGVLGLLCSAGGGGEEVMVSGGGDCSL
jgi:hypothetical protein